MCTFTYSIQCVRVCMIQYASKKCYQFRLVPFHFVPFSTNGMERYCRARAINRLCIEHSWLCPCTLSSSETSLRGMLSKACMGIAVKAPYIGSFVSG